MNTNLTIIADAATAAGAGLFGAFLALVLVVVSIAWLIFPFIVISKFNDLLKETRSLHTTIAASESHLRAMRKYYEQPVPPELPKLPEFDPNGPKRESVSAF